MFIPASVVARQAATSEQKPSPWLADYAQARKLARENGKPLFVVFRCQH